MKYSLRNCYQCGSSSVRLVVMQPANREKKCYVKCNSCHARGSRFSGQHAEEKAIARWNGEVITNYENTETNQTTLTEIIGDTSEKKS